MTRGFWKRAALAVVTGTSLTAGSNLVAAEKNAVGYEPNSTILLKSPGKADQKVTVLRSTRRADGRVYTEVKDATGKTFTMIDDAPHGSVDRADVIPASSKNPLPAAKPREYEVPPASEMAVADAPRKRLFGRDKSEPQPAPAPVAEPEKEKKPGLFSRIFGSKEKPPEPQPNQMTPQGQAYQPGMQQPYPPQGQAYQPPAPAYTPGTPPQPTYGTVTQPQLFPQTQPSPLPVATPGPNPMVPGVPAQMPATPGGTDLAPWTNVKTPDLPGVKPTTPGVTTGTTRINLTPEPPRAPSVTAPTVTIPSAPAVTAPTVTIPSAPAVTAPAITVPSVPVPSPSVPTPPVVVPPITPPSSVPFPPQVSIPKLPVPSPGPQSMNRPTNAPGIRTVGYYAPPPQPTQPTHVDVAVLDEVKPEVAILKQSKSAAERLMAVRSLANGHYGWRAEVKQVILEAARQDSAPAVRAQCIVELRDLGYFDAGFLTFLAECDRDTDAEVRDAAKSAMAKLNPKN